ncbi:MAG: MotA/TolQ/ExbB proton channel family protein [Thermoanaerobaculia bacterium]
MDALNSTFTIVGLWNAMGTLARSVVILLGLMSIWSIGLAIERFWRFALAGRESVELAEGVTPLLRDQKLDEAIDLARRKAYRHSHLGRVITAGLMKFRNDRADELPESFDLVESGKRAIDRAALMTTAEMKRGLGSLATISTTAPFIGLFGTVVGIIRAFHGMAATGSGGIGAVSSGIAEALATTAFGLIVAIPAVWLYNHFINRVERFQVEMANASSELIDYFIQSAAKAKVR